MVLYLRNLVVFETRKRTSFALYPYARTHIDQLFAVDA
jgi:hypothetical protein